jgi:hypothetical protein
LGEPDGAQKDKSLMWCGVHEIRNTIIGQTVRSHTGFVNDVPKATAPIPRTTAPRLFS